MSAADDIPTTTVDEGSHAPQPEASQPTKPLPKPSRRRDKPQLSCNLCRRRKLKCDRRQPCETCARRGLSLSCTYVNSNGTEKPSQVQHRPLAASNIPDRIAQLESLVVSLMKNVNGTKAVDTSTSQTNGLPKDLPSPPDQATHHEVPQEDQSELSNSFGRIKLTNDETSYVESAHWTAILDGIAELKDYFGDDHEGLENSELASNIPPYEGPDLLFGSVKRATRAEILAAIPAKHITDSLLAKYFGTLGLAPVVVHGPTFIKQYEQFWARPQETPIMWIGLLFAIMCTSAAYQQLTSNEFVPISQLRSPTEGNRIIMTFREKLVQCLVLGKYSKGVPYTIENLVFYMFIEMFQSEDTEIEIWLIIGLLVRLAMRMGYHRDASHSSLITPFQGEMRRRAWHVIMQMDIVTSAQMGQPSMIRDVQTDTKLPRNLRDEDFDENTIELPPSRPDNDITAVLFLISKNKLVKVFGMIHELTTSVQSPPYPEILRLDKILRDTYENLPEALHMVPMDRSIRDDLDLIIGRMYIALLFHKSQIVLHRSYLLSARNNSRYIYSRDTCLEAALQVLNYQTILEIETQSTGRLFQERWKISSIVRQEFLLATTILCLYLDRDMKDGPSRAASEAASNLEMRERIVKTLYGSYLLWLRSTDTSREAQKAAQVLRVVLGKASQTATPSFEMDASLEDISFKTVEQNLSTEMDIFMSTASPELRTVPFLRPFVPSEMSTSFAADSSYESDLLDFTIDPFILENQSIYQTPMREELAERLAEHGSHLQLPGATGYH